jgi:hypothetical protein
MIPPHESVVVTDVARDLRGAGSAEKSTWSDGVVQANSRSSAPRACLGAILGVLLVLAAGPAGASGRLTTDAFSGNASPSTVTLNQPAPRSNVTTPSFSGTAIATTQVTVKVYQGTAPEGELEAIAEAAGTGGDWSSAPASPPLRDGTFTAIASQSAGNAVEESDPVTFVVDTQAPTVTLQASPSPSNDTTPSFSGTASEATPVSIEVFSGTRPEGEPVAGATAPGTGKGWTSNPTAPTLHDGTFTAVATQQSAIGNPAGQSSAVTFSIDTSPPSVTLSQLPSPSPAAAPIFSGTASDHTPVEVQVHSGASAEGPVVASAVGDVHGGEWASARLDTPLAWGQYTAVASQPSSIGNPNGASAAMTFVLAPIAPTVATEAASAVTRTSAALYAGVDPLGGGVNACFFEYGTSSFYGKSVECGFVSEAMSAFPPSGTALVPVFARIYGLSPSTTYHFRVVAVGEGGTGDGADQTFTTQAPFSFDEQGAVKAAPPVASPPGRNQLPASAVAAWIAKQLKGFGHPGRIGALLRTGVFRAVFRAPEAGTAVIKWYYLPPSSARARAGVQTRVLSASGKVVFKAAGKATLTIRLTAAGRRLLKRSRSVRMIAACVFTALGAKPVKSSKAFELRR